MVELEPETRPVGHGGAAARQRQRGRHERVGEQLVHHLVAEREVRHAAGHLQGGERRDRALDAGVAVERDPVCLGLRGGLPQAPQPAGLVMAEDDRVGGLVLEDGPQLGRGVHCLVGRDLHVDGASHVGEPRDVARRHRLLDPVELVARQASDGVDRGRHVPRLVRVDAEQPLRTDRLADGGDDLLVVASGAPDLDVDDAVAVGGERGSVGGEVGGGVALRERHQVDVVTDTAAEERRDGDAEPFAERVPAGDLDSGEHLQRPVRREAPPALPPELAEHRLDVAGRASDERLGQQPPVGDHCRGVLADRLAVPGDARVGVDCEEHEVRPALRPRAPVERPHERDCERRRGDAGDDHARFPGPQTDVNVRPVEKRSPERLAMSIGGSSAGDQVRERLADRGADLEAVPAAAERRPVPARAPPRRRSGTSPR